MSAASVCKHCRSKVPADALECPNCGSADFASAPGAAAGGGGGDLKGAPFYVVVFTFLGLGVVAFVAVVFVLVYEVTRGPAEGDPAAVVEPVAAPVGGGGFAGVKERGKLRIAADPSSPPFLSKEGEAWIGFEGALMQAVAGSVGVPFEVVPAPFEELTAKVASGEADIAIGQLSAAVEWPGVAWSSSYLQYSYCLVGVEFGAAEPKGRIMVYDDPIAKALARRLNGQEPVVAADQQALLGPVTDFSTMALYDCPIARHDLVAMPAFEIRQDRLGLATYNVAVAEGDVQMRKDVDAVLRDLGNQGLLAKLASTWIAGTTTAENPECAVVQPGEDLAKVAARTLGDAGRAEDLYNWNADILGTDRTALYAGMALRLQR